MEPLHRDEKEVIQRVSSFDRYIHYDFRSKVWNIQEAYDQPQLSYFLYGLMLKVNDRLLIPSIPKFCKKSDILPLNILQEILSKDTQIEIDITSEKIQCEYHLMFVMRLMALLFTIGTLINIFLICKYLMETEYASITTFIISINTAFTSSMIRAMGEAPLYYFLTLTLLLILYYFRFIKDKRWSLSDLIACSIGLTSGLAISTKLNGILVLFSFWFGILFIQIKMQLYPLMDRVKHICISLLIAVDIFILLNPYVWSSPYVNIRNMITYRLQIMDDQQYYPNNAGLPGYFNKLTHITQKIFIPEKESLTTFNYPFLGIPWDLIIFVIGIYYFIRTFHLLKGLKQISFTVFIIWATLTLLLTIYLIPTDWNRYYLPIIIIVKIVQMLGIKFLFILIKRYMNTIRKHYSLLR